MTSAFDQRDFSLFQGIFKGLGFGWWPVAPFFSRENCTTLNFPLKKANSLELFSM
jgi:hypothetical protein